VSTEVEVSDLKVLRRLVDAVDHARGADRARGSFRGVALETTEGGLVAVATDGHRLAAEYDRGGVLGPLQKLLTDGASEGRFVLGPDDVEHLKRGVRLTRKHPMQGTARLIRAGEDTRGSSKLLLLPRGAKTTIELGDTEDFPNWRLVMPHKKGAPVIVDADEASAALRVCACAQAGLRSVKVELTSLRGGRDILRVSFNEVVQAPGSKRIGEVKGKADVSVDPVGGLAPGRARTFWVDPRYLADAVEAAARGGRVGLWPPTYSSNPGGVDSWGPIRVEGETHEAVVMPRAGPG